MKNLIDKKVYFINGNETTLMEKVSQSILEKYQVNKNIEISKIDLKVDLLINSKCGVFPFMTHPKAIKPSNLFIFRLKAIGISNIPGTFKILTFNLFFFKTFFEE